LFADRSFTGRSPGWLTAAAQQHHAPLPLLAHASFMRWLLLIGAFCLNAIGFAAEPPAPTLANVPYGAHERQVMDFYRAESKMPTPVVFFIHGGGWGAVIRKSCLRYWRNWKRCCGQINLTLSVRYRQRRLLFSIG
jgi:hypothetical protein